MLPVLREQLRVRLAQCGAAQAIILLTVALPLSRHYVLAVLLRVVIGALGPKDNLSVNQTQVPALVMQVCPWLS